MREGDETQLQHAEREHCESRKSANGHRKSKWPHHRPPVAPICDGAFGGTVRSPLTKTEPHSQAECDTNHNGAQSRGNRYPKGHQQGTRSDDQRKSRHTGDASRQQQKNAAKCSDDGTCAKCVDSTFAPQLGAIGDDATWNRHVRHVIRSPHARFVIVALCSCIAARVGSEVASRLPVIASGAGVAAVVVPWRAVWWACSGVVAVAALVSRHAVWNSQRCLAVLVVLTAVHGAVEWQRLASPRSGEFSGVAIARSDAVPRSYGGSTPASTRRASALSLIVEVDGENFRLTLHGVARNQIRRVKMGDVLLLDAERVPYDHRRLRFSAGRHVQGELRNVTVYGTSPAPTLWHRAANRIHELVDRGARNMQPDDAALVRGLVLGDESRQPSRMTEAFREAGLGHLLAVSGQNVVLILAALTPLLRRFTRWWRLSAALGVVVMFAVITRVESSVVRAAVMAGVVQVGFAIGRDVMPLRALAITVLGMVSVDPLATWSVGFVLSVAATTGLIAITPHLGSSIFSATTAAQLGVAPFVLLWFGSMPIVALVTNVFAVPVASLVMMIAPPLLTVAAFVPDVVAQVLGAPVVAATRWVWWVAELGARVQVPGVLNAVAWGVVVSGILWRARRS